MMFESFTLMGDFEYDNILTPELIKTFVNGVDNFSSHSKTSVAGIELDIKDATYTYIGLLHTLT
jgi:hypothetical protein